MSIFKCKMCGGSLEVQKGQTICECEYCGTKQTVSATDDEIVTNLYNRANNLRIKSEFDKAQEIYEKIVAKNPNEAEAYWGIVLCKYGIEYVEDPNTYKRVPTCHRTQLESVLTDVDYLSAMENADSNQKLIYEQEAKEIDKLQKDILSIVHNEKPFDVFICYKETDENGKRTVDSVLANDIYYQLTQEGLKVFYAAITLENKLGQEYEPYIFSALNSAKVMLVVGTKPENFNAVWVKNEWSRYLKLMSNDRSKTLIPCFRDMDAYDLPDEFSHLQAQDMSKIGFINDVVRGIKKLVAPAKEQPTNTVVVESNNTDIAPLLKRAFIFLEDGNWKDADEYCERVLDLDPENAEAYLGKLMAEQRVKKQDKLNDCDAPFDNSDNYQKAVRFADEKLKAALTGYIEHINTCNENTRLDGIYTRAKNAMSTANTESAYKEAAHLFESVSEYQDSAVLAQSCYENAEIARKKAERIAKRIKKIVIITTPIVCVIIAFIVVLNTVIIPMQKKNDFIATYGQDVYDKFGLVVEGEYIKFGAYEQDNNTSNGKEDVEWLVLEVKDGKALVVSKYALDCKQYNTSGTNVTWETCTLRNWLNNDFINAAFSADEKSMIPTVTVSVDKNLEYSTNPGNSTQDQVFLLSITEAIKHFGSGSARKCKPTDYVIANGAYVNNGNCWWWLRSPGFDQSSAAFVSNTGSVQEHGEYVNYDYGAVRPALWIDIK